MDGEENRTTRKAWPGQFEGSTISRRPSSSSCGRCIYVWYVIGRVSVQSAEWRWRVESGGCWRRGVRSGGAVEMGGVRAAVSRCWQAGTSSVAASRTLP